MPPIIAGSTKKLMLEVSPYFFNIDCFNPSLLSSPRSTGIETSMSSCWLCSASRDSYKLEISGQISNLSFSAKALAENDRLEICPEISNLYESLLAEHNQQLDIDVSIPVDLGDESKEGLKQSILKKYGETSNINFLVDPAIMGGITIKIDDEILDLSIKGRVQKLVNELNI